MNEVKRIDIKEFREKGYLQELNRTFLHPLGLALEVIVDEKTGEEKLGGVWDYRDEPGGMVYPEVMVSSSGFKKKHLNIRKEWNKRLVTRLKALKYWVQPVTVKK